jgi:hypothetical protein
VSNVRKTSDDLRRLYGGAMKRVVITAVASLWACTASAQELVQIPFAPPLPSTFIMEVTSSQRIEPGDGATQTEQGAARFTLEVRGRSGSYDAVWTLTSAEGGITAFSGETALLLGLPIQLSLGPAGEPNGVRDWNRLRERLLARRRNDSSSYYSILLSEGMPLERVSTLLAPSLDALAACHNTSLRVGVPERVERARPPSRGYASLFRATRELRAVDPQAGVARISYTRRDEVREVEPSVGEDPLLHAMTLRVECEVDLQSGVARSATVEYVSSGLNEAILRGEIRVSRQ